MVPKVLIDVSTAIILAHGDLIECAARERLQKAWQGILLH
ncbi:hypothetical protein MC7420_597 [Coleofasciculus chthonoplastes PCC 7420]|uniref:Uncharacterized protein n=1 Tax=Coleofasciculus chthonoplastes PCC 7420 TaxID=118168 RepID=B4VKR4_9CYAN|nr:hypothetical protein MC7420_597 [Coleofasciculus chthonoplastes PCC 7420]